jgi:transcriptional regulator with XRE-family HTH domain
MAGVGAAERVYKVFGAQVRKRRTFLRMTQQQLATGIELTRGSVANIEAGRQSVLLHQFLAIASALQLPPEQLLQGQASPAREQSDMPESVLHALTTIRKSATIRTPPRR